MLKKSSKVSCSFKRLARFVLYLGLCVTLGTGSLCGVAFGAGGTTNDPVADFNDSEGDTPYSKIIVDMDDCVERGTLPFEDCEAAVDIRNFTGTHTLNLDAKGYIIKATDSGWPTAGIHLFGSNESEDNIVTINNSATISASSPQASAGLGIGNAKVIVEAKKIITINSISSGEETARGIGTENSELDASASELKVSDVSGTEACGYFNGDSSYGNIGKLTIEGIKATGNDKKATAIYNGPMSAIKINGDLTIKDIEATGNDGKAFAIYNYVGAITAGFEDDGVTPNPETAVQIEGDIMSLTIDPEACYTKLALANDTSYFKGNFIPYDPSTADFSSNFLTLQDGGTWYPTFDETTHTSENYVDVVFNSDGVINLNDKDWDGKSVPVRAFRTLEIYGNVPFGDDKFVANDGIFVINTHLAEGKGDVINLCHANVSGNAKVKVAYDPFYLTGAAGQVTGTHKFLITPDNTKITITAAQTKWTTGGKTIIFTPTVEMDADGQSWKITSLAGSSEPEPGPEPEPIVVVVSETAKAISDTANAVNMAWLQSINNLQKRLGDLRGGAESNTGWVRFQRSLDDLNNGRKLNISGNLYQIGYDFALKNDVQSRGYFGLSLERFDGNQSFNIGGGDLKSTTVSAYYTKIYNSGHYFDFILRYGKYDSDTTSYDASTDNPLLTKLDYAENGVTLSGEYGYRANIGKGGLYLEPQAELIYGYLDGAKKISSSGILADIDSTSHFVTRLGLALGQRVKNFNYYLRGSYYHDFAGSTNITYEDMSYKQDSAQNWWEVSLGGGWNMSNNSYFYAELTKHFKDVSNSLNFNLGFRFTL